MSMLSGEAVSPAPWSLPHETVADQLRVDLQRGLSSDESARRLAANGPNHLRETPPRSRLQIFASQFADLMILLLAAAAVISAAIGEWSDALLIAVIVVANATIGAVQEFRADKAVEALQQFARPSARVWRDGWLSERPAVEIVAGDLVELRAGDFVPADARVIAAAELQTAEAALTGESMPVEKSPDPVAAETGLSDRRSMLFAGTAVTLGHGKAIVTSTGMNTELGKIATLMQTAEDVQTPLQRRLAALSKRLAILVLVVGVVIIAAGIFRGDKHRTTGQLWGHMMLVAVSLAVAAIPEGLPAVITIALSLGSQRMARRKAIIRKLPAVETLGSVDVICSDKTGTLTQNRMMVSELIASSEGPAADEALLKAGILCNDAMGALAGGFVGTATEVAILEAAAGRQLDPDLVRNEWPRLAEIPFSSSRKRMATLHRRTDGRRMIVVKGAAEALLDRCDRTGPIEETRQLTAASREQWRERVEALATRGRRVLAVACRDWDSDAIPVDSDEPESSLSLLGLFGIFDPVRPEARVAIASCRSAGIRPVMITGDHQATARAIAEDLDLFRPGDRIVSGAEMQGLDSAELERIVPEVAIYARVAPEHKLRIVKAWQARGSVVAMTGDGVNDAPALRQADIGVAMGMTGTDVSKEAADAVLVDDNFATIVAAVEEGRVVYDNIRKFVRYLLTTNTGEVLVLFLAILVGLPLPLLPIQILWINLVTDGLPALALAFESAEQNVMGHPPRRRDESIFAGGLARDIVLYGFLMAVATLLAYWAFLSGAIPIEFPAATDDVRVQQQFIEDYARTMAFLILSAFQLFYVLGVRSSTRLLVELPRFSNPKLTAAVIIGLGAQLAVTYLPLLQRFFHTVSLSLRDLLIGMAVATTAFLAAELQKLAHRVLVR